MSIQRIDSTAKVVRAGASEARSNHSIMSTIKMIARVTPGKSRADAVAPLGQSAIPVDFMKRAVTYPLK
jgi:hypothetical protein